MYKNFKKPTCYFRRRYRSRYRCALISQRSQLTSFKMYKRWTKAANAIYLYEREVKSKARIAYFPEWFTERRIEIQERKKKKREECRDKSNAGSNNFFLSRSSWRVRTVEEGRWPARGHPCRCCSIIFSVLGRCFYPALLLPTWSSGYLVKNTR